MKFVNPLHRLSKKHICNYRDCSRYARWKCAMCLRHNSAGSKRVSEGRPLSEKSKKHSESRLHTSELQFLETDNADA